MSQGRHKRMHSDLQECPWWNNPGAPCGNAAKWDQAPSMVTSPGATRSRGGKMESGARENNGLLLSCSSPKGAGSHEETTVTSSTSVLEGTLKYKGVKVRVKSSHTAIHWKPAAGSMAWCLELAALKTKIPYDEVLGAWVMHNERKCGYFGRSEAALVVAALRRGRTHPNRWQLEEHKLVAGSPEQAREWVAAITSALQLCHHRPRALLVFINPVSGSRRARQVWECEAAPVFFKAGIKFSVIETLEPGHAQNTLANMKADELALYQGVVAVGGDGVFQECMMGVLAQRARGGKNAAVSARLRVGHIPGGSTDAVAYTLHGTRSAEAAALHIALGDRLALDVARVDCEAPPPPTTTTTTTPATVPEDSAHTQGDLPGAPQQGGTTTTTTAKATSSSSVLQSVLFSNDTLSASGSKELAGESICLQPASSCSLGQELAAAGKGGRVSSRGNTKSGGVDTGLAPGGLAAAPGLTGVPGQLSTRYFVCQAAYGFLGDVMHFSEGLRFMGPTRYDVSGAVQWLRLRSYPLSITYRTAAHQVADKLRVCSHPCEACRLAGINMVHHTHTDESLSFPDAAQTTTTLQSAPLPNTTVTGGAKTLGLGAPLLDPPPARMTSLDLPSSTSCDTDMSGALRAAGTGRAAGAGASGEEGGRDGWVTEQGEYVSVMAVVTPCRSDKSQAGIIPHAHLADGRIYLVLVSKCGRLDYLRFLIRLSTKGLEDGCFPFVKVVPITAATIKPLSGAPESCWNVDGELLPSSSVKLRVHRGLVDVFARGVELGPPLVH